MEEPPLQTDPGQPGWMPPPRHHGGRRSRRARDDQHAGEQWQGWHSPAPPFAGPRFGPPRGPWAPPGHPRGPAAAIGSLRRDLEYRLAGGVAAGIAARRGRRDRVTAIRVLFCVVALISWGWAVPLYFVGWLLIPGEGETASIGARARHDSRGIALALGLMSLTAVILLAAALLNEGFIDSWGWPQVVSIGCLALIWRNAPPAEQETMRHLVEPLSGVGGTASERTTRRATMLRLGLAGVLVLSGLVSLLSARATIALLRPLGGLVLLAAGVVLLLGPWWFRIARDVVLERQARARAEERAEVAARVHDSVLQTLALIQRRSDDPAAIVALARAQERELRSWLFEGRAPGAASSGLLADGIREIQQEVEARHGVPVEVVTVGDCPVDEELSALLGAAREAVVNAAKWSGAPVISLFTEVGPDKTEVVVRDRGKGFDPASVTADRKGLAESVRGRMSRHGGTVVVQTAPGEGTKVTLTMPGKEKEGNR